MFDNKWQRKEMPLVSLIGMSGGIASPAFLSSIVLEILAPTIISPANNSGLASYTIESSEIVSTADGGSVSARVDVGNKSLHGAAFGGGRFVCVADGGGDTSTQVLHFEDPSGTISYSAAAETGNYWRDVAYGFPSTGAHKGQGMFVATSQIGGTNRIMYSVDGGANWSGASPAVSVGDWYGVGYGDGKFVAVGYESTGKNHVMHSTDGITWTAASDLGTAVDSNATTNYWNGVAYGNGKWVAVSYYGSSSRIMYSTDADVWTTITDAEVSWDGSTHGWWNVIYAGGKFVAITSESRAGIRPTIVSEDGIAWQQSDVTPYDNLRRWSDIAYGNGIYVAIAGNNQVERNAIYYSTDAITWYNSNPPGHAEWNGIAYGNGKWVAVCSSGSWTSGRLAWSEDGITWDTNVTDVTLTDTTITRDGALIDGASIADTLSPGKRVYSIHAVEYWIHRLLQERNRQARVELRNQLPIFTDNSGNVIFAGVTHNTYQSPTHPQSPNTRPALITKYDGGFNRLWQKTFNVSGLQMDCFTAGVCDSSDNIYLVGDTYVDTSYAGGYFVYDVASGANEIMLVKFDSSGNLQWQTGLGGLGGAGGGLKAAGVELDSSGNIYATGKTQPDRNTTGHPMDIWVAKWNSSGTLLWKRQLGDSSNSDNNGTNGGSQGLRGNDIAVNPSTGDCYVVSDSWLIAKWDTNGTLQWQKRPYMSWIGNSQASSFSGSSITIDSSGNIITTGQDWRKYSSTNNEWVAPVIKMDPSGTILWYKVADPGNGDTVYGVDIKCDSLDNIIVLGYGEDNNALHSQCWLAKLDSSGNTSWSRCFGSGSYDDDTAGSLAIDSADDIIFTDRTEEGPLMAKLPSDGQVLGSGTYSATFKSKNGQDAWYSSVGNWDDMADITYGDDYFSWNTPYTSIGTYTANFNEIAGKMSVVTPAGTVTSYGPGESNAYIFDSPGYGILGPSQHNQTPILQATNQTAASVSSTDGATITLTDISGAWSPGMKFNHDIVYPDAISATNALIVSGPPALSQTSEPWPDGVAQWQSAQWELATNSDFTENVQSQNLAISGTGSQTGPSFTLAASTGYYIRVRYKALGNKSDWSSSVHFVTAA